ncbi:MAG: TRAP transporter small permease [Formivibrio sp.]|nr:TRAP transporter small permease [Formivibrio sp.]
MKFLIPRLDALIEYLMALALIILLVAVFSNAVLRYALDTGIPAAEEVARLMFIWITFLGAILALRRHALLGIELVQAMLPRKIRRICAIISNVLILYALGLFFYGSWEQTLIGLHTYSTVLRFPTALMSSSGLVCAGSMILIVLANLWRIVTNHPDAHLPGDSAHAVVAQADNFELGGEK